MPTQSSLAVIGSGPAGLMAAYVAAQEGIRVVVFEKKRGPGRKLLIAGSTGLNISFDSPEELFWQNYHGPKTHFQKLFRTFPPNAWLEFVRSLGIQTFLGTSRRYFVEDMKGSPLLRAWTSHLREKGVEFRFDHELTDFESNNNGVTLRFSNGSSETFGAACLALGGGSYEPKETPLRWPNIFINKDLHFAPFRPSNVGYELRWPAELLKEAEGLPLKNIVLTTARGSRKGDLVLTRYGLEGTPVYHVGVSGDAVLDLKPDLDHAEILKKLNSVRENLSPIRRAKKTLGLCPASFALLFHCTPKAVLADLTLLARQIKSLPLTLTGPRPLQEAISSAGGLAFDELTEELMIKNFPGVFVAGEMLDWDAPTGGFLIQACASQGFLAGRGIASWLKASFSATPSGNLNTSKQSCRD